MSRCPICGTDADDTAIVCAACGRELPYRRPRSPKWHRMLGWVMIWVAFAVSIVAPDALGFAFLVNCAGWVLFLEDDVVLRVTFGVVLAIVICQLGVAIGDRWLPMLREAR